MKMKRETILGVVLMVGTIGAHAAGASSGDTRACESHLADYYGKAADMRYVGERRYMDGTEMKFAVRETDARTGYSTTRLAVCWMGAENYQAYTGSDEENMVAEVDTGVSVAKESPLFD